MTGLLLPASFIAAFLAGLVALFAPCCITFLLPSYLGSVFKTRSRILFMTFVFGLGIFVILLPAVLGISFVSRFLFRYHDLAYYTGGVAMVIAGLLALWGVKFALPRLPRPTAPQGQPDIFSRRFHPHGLFYYFPYFSGPAQHGYLPPLCRISPENSCHSRTEI